MFYRLVRPMQRKGSSKHQFVKRIPTDLRERMVGMSIVVPIGDETVHLTVSPNAQSIRFSLRASDPSEVKDRQASAASYLERLFASLRENRPIALTHRNAVALSGDLYRAWASDLEKGRSIALVHTEQGWVRDDEFDSEEAEAEYAAAMALVDRLQASDDPEALERSLGPIADRLLADRGITLLDAPSRQMVLKEFLKALRDGFEVRRRKAGGDYGPDPKAERFPEWQTPEGGDATQMRPAGASSLTALVESWWIEAKAAGLAISTYESYRNTMARFVAYLDHDDATRVTAADVIGFKDHRLAAANPRTGKPISPKTIKDNDLAGLKAVFGWAVTNRRIPSNPAQGITIKIGKQVRTRSKGFTDSEARALLSHALSHQRGREKKKTFMAKRWIPWLCAYTGARVGEMAQLRKQDLRREGKQWVIRLTPEAGTIKTKEAREIPVHEHLVELEFIDFVEASAEGYLFLTPAEDGSIRGAWRGVKNRMVDFARQVVEDRSVAPNHGWRHLFKTIGIEAGIQERVLDAMCGHATKSVGATYGDVTIKAMADGLSKFPKFKVD